MSYGPPELPIARGEKTELRIPGSWQALRGLSETFRTTGTQAKEAADKLRPIDKPELWKGNTAEGFRRDLHSVIAVLDRYATVCPKIGTEIFDYSEVVRFTQGECAFQIDPMAAQAYAMLDQYVDALAVYDGAKQRNEQDKANNVPKECRAVVPDKPNDTAAQKLLHKAQRQLAQAYTRANDANAKCLLQLRGHLDELWNTPDYSFNAFVRGIKDGTIEDIKEFIQLAWTLDPARIMVDGPATYFTDLAAIAEGLSKPLYDPVGFAQDVKTSVVRSWDDFVNNPAYATGHAVPDLILAAVPGGGAAKTSEAITAAAARVEARRTAEKEAAEKAAKDAPPAGQPCTRPTGSCGLAGEPVDVATGEMVLDQTDVTLAAALPLVLRRRHRTLFNRGRFFGRRWASTLDQHLELHPDGVVLITDEGVEVQYPVPVPDAAVFPSHGPRWPLTWDGATGGAITVTDPRAGHTWTFAPLPGLPGPVLPIRSVHDRNGNRIDYHYGTHGLPTEVRHSGGYRIAVDTAEGRVIGLRLLDADPETHLPAEGLSTRLLSFGYGPSGDVTDVVNSSDRPLQFTYDDRHRITSWTDRNGTWYQYTYDSAGRCVHGVGTDGVLDNTFTYDTDAQVTHMTDALGAVREFAWDASGRVVRETDPLGNTVTTVWDAYHRRTAGTDQNGHTTRFTYDDAGNPTGIVYPDGTYTLADHDPRLCRPTRVINPDGTRRHFTWDDHGNLLTTTDESGAETRYTYNESGHLTGTTDALGATTTVTCDPTGRPVAVTNPLGHTTRATRDAFGRVFALIDPLGHTTRTAYTIEGQPAWRELPDGSSESWTWDAEGNLLHHQNAAGFTTRYETGVFDLPTAQTGPDGHRYTFTYDTELHLTAVTNPQSLTWTYAYDSAGRLTSETDFNGRTLTYRHDPAGRLTTRINGAGEQVDYTRDPFGNITTSAHTATGRTTTYTYDPMGRLAHAVNPDADLAFTRDPCGRILTETSNGRTLRNTYDALGRRTRRETPSGHISDWTYDAAGQPTQLATAGHTLDFAHDAAGRETTRHFGNHVTFTQTYDASDRPTAQALAVGPRPDKVALALSPELAPPEVHRRTYEWRPDGYITRIADTATGTRTFELDTVGRVTVVTAPGRTERYAYDSLGNITHAQWPDTRHDTSGQGARLHAGTRTIAAGRTRFGYDRQGRVVRKTRVTPSGKRLSWEFSWDADDRLVGATTPTGESWVYTYDALARRVSKRLASSPSGDEAYVETSWDGLHTAEKRDGRGGALIWETSPQSRRPLLQRNFREGGTQTDDSVRMLAVDASGTVFATVDPDGAADHRRNTSIWSPTAAEHFGTGFLGQHPDAELDSLENYFRQYDAESATYLSPDPLGLAAGFHNYTYVGNPLTWSDPLGLMTCPPHPTVSPGQELLDGQAQYHILYGDSTGGGHLWPGQPGKSVFPPGWDKEKVLDSVADVATSPNSVWTQQTGPAGALYTNAGNPSRWKVEGVVDGVNIRVIYEPATGRVVTGFPFNP